MATVLGWFSRSGYELSISFTTSKMMKEIACVTEIVFVVPSTLVNSNWIIL